MTKIRHHNRAACGAENIRRKNPHIRVVILDQIRQGGQSYGAEIAQQVHSQIARRGIVGTQERNDRVHHLRPADFAQSPVHGFLHTYIGTGNVTH
jgi:CRISPR/Cas system CSM-associated protein Csm5 (group 7 of RAMP superfamily)